MTFSEDMLHSIVKQYCPYLVKEQHSKSVVVYSIEPRINSVLLYDKDENKIFIAYDIKRKNDGWTSITIDGRVSNIWGDDVELHMNNEKDIPILITQLIKFNHTIKSDLVCQKKNNIQKDFI